MSLPPRDSRSVVTCGTGSPGVTLLQGSPVGAVCQRAVMLGGGG